MSGVSRHTFKTSGGDGPGAPPTAKSAATTPGRVAERMAAA